MENGASGPYGEIVPSRVGRAKRAVLGCAIILPHKMAGGFVWANRLSGSRVADLVQVRQMTRSNYSIQDNGRTLRNNNSKTMRH